MVPSGRNAGPGDAAERRLRPDRFIPRLVLPSSLSTRIRAFLIAAGLTLAQALGAGFAPATAQEETPVKREILALYDGAQEGDANSTRIHRFAELPLNHLGLVLRFHDVREKLPEPAEIARYRGVLTWFAGPVPHSETYLAWASRVSQLNVRYVILGDVGVPINAYDILVVNRLLALAGVRHTGEYIAPTLGTRVAQIDPGLVEFECRLDPVLPDYPVVQASGANARIGVTLETPPNDGGRTSVLVAIGAKGGYAALNYEMRHPRPPLYQGRWLINPFDFFRAAFGSDGEPIPDTTTASGNRLYFNVLESDGLTRPSTIEGFENEAAGEVVLHALIERYPGLPASLDLHAEELARSERPGAPAQRLVQSLLAHRNVDLLQRPLQATLSRFDSEYPSISNLAPLTSAGPDPLINRPMSDETAYPSSVAGENGFSALRETVDNTNVPRRLTPLDLNDHAFSGAYSAEFRSVEDRVAAASLMAVTPVSANRYAAIVDGFLSAQIDRLGGARWRIRNRGALQTVRFDDVDGREVDFASSLGVIGSRRDGPTLYVALDEAIEPAVVALAPSAPAGPDALALVESRWLLRNVVRDGCNLRFEAQGYGEGSFTWSGASDGRTIVVERAGQEVWRGSAEAEKAGRLRFVIPVSGVDGVTVRIPCGDAGRFLNP